MEKASKHLHQSMIDMEDVYHYIGSQPMIKALIMSKQLSLTDIQQSPIDCLDYVEDRSICKGCKALVSCPKSSKGYQTELVQVEGRLQRQLVPCQFLAAYDKTSRAEQTIVYKNVSRQYFRHTFESLKPIIEKHPVLINWFAQITSFITAYPNTEKGTFVGGSKSFIQMELASALTTELSNRGIKVAFVSFPDFLGELKKCMNHADAYFRLLEVVKEAPVLVLDDIGNESNISGWSRDDVLGAILNHRYNQQLPTYTFSMFTLSELNELYHISASKDFKASILIEKIKALSKIYEL